MGIGDIFKKIIPSSKPLTYAQILSRSDTISMNEKQYYQPDSYYTQKTHIGTPFERDVVTFEERIKNAIPSSTGLYVPEILMLHFCKSFPNPKNGYPAYWWFQYGVRNVGAMLYSLVERGYIEINEKSGKYKLTSKGEKEQTENEYVYFTHYNSLDTNFDAWEMNKLLGSGDKSNYVEIFKKNCHSHKLDEFSKSARVEQVKSNSMNNDEALPILRQLDSAMKSDDVKVRVKADDKYIEIINLRDAQYKIDKNIEQYILFWEDNWKNNRPLLGAHWAFVLPDLYIKTKRYEDALNCIEILRAKGFTDKAEKYYCKIKDKMSK